MCIRNLIIPFGFIITSSCNVNPQQKSIPKDSLVSETHAIIQVPAYDTNSKTIHVFVSLCDNKYQGIVPVPAKLGNGQHTAGNLYWGAGYGIKTHFGKSNEWSLIRTQAIDTLILERLIYKHKRLNYYLVADAYNGQYIKHCTEQMLLSAAGRISDTVQIGSVIIGTHGNAALVSYIGHDGLMEFELNADYKNADGKTRDCIILACASRQFFTPYLNDKMINPIVWTSNLMCPEAYTLHDALTGYILKENNEQIRTRAAKAYSRYQKCTEDFARDIIVTGW